MGDDSETAFAKAQGKKPHCQSTLAAAMAKMYPRKPANAPAPSWSALLFKRM